MTLLRRLREKARRVMCATFRNHCNTLRILFQTYCNTIPLGTKATVLPTQLRLPRAHGVPVGGEAKLPQEASVDTARSDAANKR